MRTINVFVEFHPYDVFVNGRDTRELLLKGHCHGGLYSARSNYNQEVFCNVKTSLNKWHSRLGHLASLFLC